MPTAWPSSSSRPNFNTHSPRRPQPHYSLPPLPPPPPPPSATTRRPPTSASVFDNPFLPRRTGHRNHRLRARLRRRRPPADRGPPPCTATATASASASVFAIANHFSPAGLPSRDERPSISVPPFSARSPFSARTPFSASRRPQPGYRSRRPNITISSETHTTKT
ncbi:hypothetical protein STAS_06191 [Striga asiatica]|uniref:Uncharacterized protein n=1 Tax=Striga asiatica TaxID=4170 RepID=A0A5A7PBQ4_STRAF|nr:hypothetical protein STAS_06191 [Striga asiatica]